MSDIYDALPDALQVESDGPIRIVRLNRPEQLNATNRELHAGLAAWTVQRAYSTGTNPQVDSVARASGFGIDVPGIYRFRRISDSALVAASRPNDVDPLIRSVLVTWRPLDETPPTPENALDWRDTMVPQAYEWEQTTRRDTIQTSTEAGDAGTALQVEGFWLATDDGQPLGGSVVLRVVDCPDQGRRYLLDSWLYVPNRGKHLYLTELKGVLDSFRCTPDA